MAIPKLFQWLAVISAFMSVWLAFVTGYFLPNVEQRVSDVITVMPLYLLMLFACYSLAVIGYRVATFNDCKEAADELRKDVLDARKDLERKGYKYSSDWK